MNYIREKHSELYPLYDEIYNKNNRSYWRFLDNKLREFADNIGLDYVTNDDSMTRDFSEPPVIVNYFYHEEIKKSAKKEK